MRNQNYLKIEFPSLSANEGFARAALSAFASRLDPTMEELGDIKTAVSEAVTNAIVHAYPSEIGKIHIRAKISNDTLEIVIRDKGRGIADINKALEPLFTTGGDDRSGMGFTIMQSFMDKLKVRSKSGSGTTVTMKKVIRSKKHE